MKKPKILIIGSARWGKDSLAEIWAKEFELKYKSSSQAASEIFIFDTLKYKYGYLTPEECFDDRINHREEWFNLISEYNINDKSRLAKEILRYNDCYVGMRSNDEIMACKAQNLFDYTIWVDASKRLPKEPSTSFDIDSSVTDFIIENNTTFDDFNRRALVLGQFLFFDRDRFTL